MSRPRKTMLRYLAILTVLCLPEGPTAAHGADYFELRDGLRNSRTVFEEMQRGRVAFLGGSITNMKGWRDLVSADLKRRFPATQFEFINAGIPSTGSTPGAFRLTRDVLMNGQVDLLFEEAAVNDQYNGRSSLEQVRAMEGIVRHARMLHPNIDIVLMHFVDPPKMEAYNAGRVPVVIRNHERVAEHYQVPSINLALEVTERIGRGEFSWEEDFRDLHPSPFGHELYCRAIARCLDAAWSDPPGDRAPAKYSLPPKLDPFCYDAGALLSPEAVGACSGFELDQRWENHVGGGTRPGFVRVPMLVGTRPGDRLEFNFEGTAVGLFVAAGPDAGVIEFMIDDGPWAEQDLFTEWSAGLHIPWLHVLAAEMKQGEQHTLKVRISSRKNDRSKGHACRIVHMAVNGKGQ